MESGEGKGIVLPAGTPEGIDPSATAQSGQQSSDVVR